MNQNFNFDCQEIRCVDGDDDFVFYLYGREILDDDDIQFIREQFSALREEFSEFSFSGNMLLMEYVFWGNQSVFLYLTMKISRVTICILPVMTPGVIDVIFPSLVPLISQVLSENFDAIISAQKEAEQKLAIKQLHSPLLANVRADEIIAAMEQEIKRKKRRS